MSANFGIFEINFINIIICHYYYYYLNGILTKFVALKSSLLTVSPRDSPQDQGSPKAGLGLGRSEKCKKEQGQYSAILIKRDWTIGQKENFFLCNQGSPGNPEWVMGPFCLHG